MEKVFKLKGVSIPQIKEKYLKNFRSIFADNNEDGEYVEALCLPAGTEDFSGYPDLQISITEEVGEKVKNGGGYVCVETFKEKDVEDKDIFISTFHRDPIALEDGNGKSEKIKPYSTLMVRSRIPEFVVGKSYIFAYKIV